MELSNRLKERFCKDIGINVGVYREDIFRDRLRLCDKLDEYNSFVNLIEERFDGNEESYFAYYNNVKDAVINFIKESEMFRFFNSDEAFATRQKERMDFNVPDKEVYKQYNIGRKLISIDMKKANFTALVHFANVHLVEFFDSYCYENFIGRFTDIPHIKNSKYIRQVVFGNCNPKRQISYEKVLTGNLLKSLLAESLIREEDIFSFKPDEIVLYADGFTDDGIMELKEFINGYFLPYSFEFYTLLKFDGCDAYVKQVTDFVTGEKKYEPKCVSPFDMPRVYRFLKNEPMQESDLYFTHEKRLAKFMDEPKELSLITTPCNL